MPSCLTRFILRFMTLRRSPSSIVSPPKSGDLPRLLGDGKVAHVCAGLLDVDDRDDWRDRFFLAGGEVGVFGTFGLNAEPEPEASPCLKAGLGPAPKPEPKPNPAGDGWAGLGNGNADDDGVVGGCGDACGLANDDPPNEKPSGFGRTPVDGKGSEGVGC